MVNFTINAVHLLRAYCVLGMTLDPRSTLVNITDKVPSLIEYRLRSESMVRITKWIIHNLVSACLTGS